MGFKVYNHITNYYSDVDTVGRAISFYPNEGFTIVKYGTDTYMIAIGLDEYGLLLKHLTDDTKKTVTSMFHLLNKDSSVKVHDKEKITQELKSFKQNETIMGIGTLINAYLKESPQYISHDYYEAVLKSALDALNLKDTGLIPNLIDLGIADKNVLLEEVSTKFFELIEELSKTGILDSLTNVDTILENWNDKSNEKN